jgi:PEP-CTERM motif
MTFGDECGVQLDGGLSRVPRARIFLDLLLLWKGNSMRKDSLSAVALVAAAGWCAPVPAEAAYVVIVQESAGNVVANGSGSLDLTDLTFVGLFSFHNSQIQGDFATIIVGANGAEPTDIYSGFSGPASMGSGSATFADGGVGKKVGLSAGTGVGDEVLGVPAGYLSGSLLTESSFWSAQTLSSLGIDPGTYVYSWGSGDHADTFTIEVTVPEPSTWALMLAGFGGLGYVAWRRRRREEGVTT